MLGRILFVDDETNVLRGLRRMLHSMRNDWEMAFADGGGAALEALEQAPADVIVSDMRMPVMDGGALLTEVARRYPEMIRIVLSGRADQDATFRVVGPSHQFLSKPCDHTELIGKIRRCMDLRSTMRDPSSHLAATRLAVLPSPERVVERLETALSKTAPDIDAVAEVVEADVALTAKVLQISNSTYFRVGSPIISPAHATRVLGIDVLAPLFDQGRLARTFQARHCNASFEEAWRQSLAAAEIARRAATALDAGPEKVELAATAARLHLIGRLALICGCADQQADEPPSLDKADVDRFALGVYLTALWGVPDRINTLLRFAPIPMAHGSGAHPVLAAVHLGLCHCGARTRISGHDGKPPELDESFLDKQGLGQASAARATIAGVLPASLQPARS